MPTAAKHLEISQISKHKLFHRTCLQTGAVSVRPDHRETIARLELSANGKPHKRRLVSCHEALHEKEFSCDRNDSDLS